MKYVKVQATITFTVPSYLKKEAELLKNECTLATLKNLNDSEPIPFESLYNKVKKVVAMKLNEGTFKDYVRFYMHAGIVHQKLTPLSPDDIGYEISPLGKRLLKSVSG